MANQAGHDLTADPVDISDGIAADTEIIVQVVSGVEVYIVEATDADDGKPNRVRGDPYFDSAGYTIGTDPIWAYTSGGKAELAMSY